MHRPGCCKQVYDSEVTVVCSSVGFGHFSSLNLISLFGSKQNTATSIARWNDVTTFLFQSLIYRRELSYGSTSGKYNGVTLGVLGLTWSGSAPRTIGKSVLQKKLETCACCSFPFFVLALYFGDINKVDNYSI